MNSIIKPKDSTDNVLKQSMAAALSPVFEEEKKSEARKDSGGSKDSRTDSEKATGIKPKNADMQRGQFMAKLLDKGVLTVGEKPKTF